MARVLTGVEGCSSTRSTRRSNKLVVLDASVDLAKKASEEAGAEVMVVMRFPDCADPAFLASSSHRLTTR
jgi:hypothetical protein